MLMGWAAIPGGDERLLGDITIGRRDGGGCCSGGVPAACRRSRSRSETLWSCSGDGSRFMVSPLVNCGYVGCGGSRDDTLMKVAGWKRVFWKDLREDGEYFLLLEDDYWKEKNNGFW